MKKTAGARSGDGWITTPAGMRIHFYTLDGQFTLGNRAFSEVMADGGIFWRGHTAQVAPNYHADVDLAILEIEGHKRHLSQVLELAADNGIAYERLHAGFCRVDR